MRDIMELAKVRVITAVALTTFLGYVLARQGFDWGFWPSTLGIFLLAAGSAALNHYQERDVDGLMDRTKNRPLPSGRMRPAVAMLWAVLFSLSGLAMLYWLANLTAALLGLLNLVWYNAIYTPLKKVTPFAVVPGSVVGALPPMVGWVAGGEHWLDIRILMVAFFFFIWQIPHFWMLVIKLGKQYEAAGFPSLTQRMSPSQIKGMSLPWVFATALSANMLPFFGVTHSRIIAAVLLLAALWLVAWFARQVQFHREEMDPRQGFMKINYFTLTVMVALVVDALSSLV